MPIDIPSPKDLQELKATVTEQDLIIGRLRKMAEEIEARNTLIDKDLTFLEEEVFGNGAVSLLTTRLDTLGPNLNARLTEIGDMTAKMTAGNIHIGARVFSARTNLENLPNVIRTAVVEQGFDWGEDEEYYGHKYGPPNTQFNTRKEQTGHPAPGTPRNWPGKHNRNKYRFKRFLARSHIMKNYKQVPAGLIPRIEDLDLSEKHRDWLENPMSSHQGERVPAPLIDGTPSLKVESLPGDRYVAGKEPNEPSITSAVGAKSLTALFNEPGGIKAQIANMMSWTKFDNKDMYVAVADMWALRGQWVERIRGTLDKIMIDVPGIAGEDGQAFSLRDVVNGLLTGDGPGQTILQRIYARDGAGTVKTTLEDLGERMQQRLESLSLAISGLSSKFETAHTQLGAITIGTNTEMNNTQASGLVSPLVNIATQFADKIEEITTALWAILHPDVSAPTIAAPESVNNPNVVNAMADQTVPVSRYGTLEPSELRTMAPEDVEDSLF